MVGIKKYAKHVVKTVAVAEQPLRAPKLEKQGQTFDFKACNGIITVMRACVPKNACTRRLAYPFNLLSRASLMNLCVLKLCASDGTQAAFPNESPPQSSIGVWYFRGSSQWQDTMPVGALQVQSSITMHSMWDVHILHARTNFSDVQSNFACLEGGYSFGKVACKWSAPKSMQNMW